MGEGSLPSVVKALITCFRFVPHLLMDAEKSRHSGCTGLFFACEDGVAGAVSGAVCQACSPHTRSRRWLPLLKFACLPQGAPHNQRKHISKDGQTPLLQIQPPLAPNTFRNNLRGYEQPCHPPAQGIQSEPIQLGSDMPRKQRRNRVRLVGSPATNLAIMVPLRGTSLYGPSTPQVPVLQIA